MFGIRTTEKEYQIIKENAQRANKRVAPYIRDVAQHPIIKKSEIDYSEIAAHTEEIAEVTRAINHLVFTIEATGTYTDREMAHVVDMITGIYNGQQALLESMRKKLRAMKRKKS